MRSAWGGRATTLVATSLVVVLGLTACTADDGGEQDDGQAVDELPVEVEGEVLDRREPEAAEEPDADGEAEAGTDEPGDAAAEPDDPDEADADDEAAPSTSPAPTSPAPTTPAPTSPAPTTPAPTSPAPTSPAPTRPAPTEPAPAATPAPRVLAAGPARSTGPVLDSDGVDWTVSSSTTVERGVQPPALTVATRPGDDAPQRQVACAASLEAPSDRGLVARGTLTVSLRVTGTDGSVQVLPRQRIELDVTLEPGRRLDLAVSPGRTVDVAEVRQITCVADLAD